MGRRAAGVKRASELEKTVDASRPLHVFNPMSNDNPKGSKELLDLLEHLRDTLIYRMPRYTELLEARLLDAGSWHVTQPSAWMCRRKGEHSLWDDSVLFKLGQHDPA